MSDQARIERVEPDPWGAHTYVEQARKLLADGGQESNSPEGRRILLHAAAIAACDAVLAINGRQVDGVLNGHRLRLETAEDLLGGAHRDLFDELDDARADRNVVSYRAGPVAAADIGETYAAVETLIALVSAQVRPHLPNFLLEQDDSAA